MPAIRGVYYSHPTTTELGLWIMLLNGQVVGVSDAQIATLRPGSGSVANRKAGFRTALIGALQPLLEKRTPLSNWSVEDQAALIANPAPFCRIDGTDYVARDSVVDFEIIGLNPVRVQITISEGASRAQFGYS